MDLKISSQILPSINPNAIDLYFPSPSTNSLPPSHTSGPTPSSSSSDLLPCILNRRLPPSTHSFLTISSIDSSPMERNAMFLSVELEWPSSSITLTAFVDSGATGGNYISKSFVVDHGIPCSPSSQVEVSNFTGATSTNSSCITSPITLLVGRHHTETISFIVLDDCRHSLILGYDWLFQHNPSTDWVKPSVGK